MEEVRNGEEEASLGLLYIYIYLFVGFPLLTPPSLLLASFVAASFEDLHFNVSSGKCVAIAAGQRMPDTAVVAFSDRSRDAQSECEPGHYCLKGVRYKCSKGRYGDKARETNSTCTGECEQGYYCEEGSSDKRQFHCGGAHLFCPANSSTPTRVLPGHYTNENSAENVRSSQAICPPGYYCVDGKRYMCKEGHYGEGEGNTVHSCEGKCDPGHWCSAGSSSRAQNEVRACEERTA